MKTNRNMANTTMREVDGIRGQKCAKLPENLV